MSGRDRGRVRDGGPDWQGKSTGVAHGYRRCIGTITSSSRHAPRESQQGARRDGVVWKGGRCRIRVSPSQQKKMRAIVCPSHEQQYVDRLHEEALTNLRLRRKYDPGPLPLAAEDD